MSFQRLKVCLSIVIILRLSADVIIGIVAGDAQGPAANAGENSSCGIQDNQESIGTLDCSRLVLLKGWALTFC